MTSNSFGQHGNHIRQNQEGSGMENAQSTYKYGRLRYHTNVQQRLFMEAVECDANLR